MVEEALGSPKEVEVCPSTEIKDGFLRKKRSHFQGAEFYKKVYFAEPYFCFELGLVAKGSYDHKGG